MPEIAAARTESDLLQHLLRLDRRARLVSLANSLGLTALFVGIVVAVAIVADSLWELPLGIRIALLATAGLVALCGCAWGLGRSMLRRADPAAAAALVESLHPELHERLSSAIELEQSTDSGSPLMRALVASQAEQSLRSVDLAAPLPVIRTTRRGAAGAAVLAAILAPCLFFGGYRLLLQRFATPWKNLERAANLYFDVSPGDARVSRGADVEITAAPQWRFAQTQVDTAWLHWHDAAGNRLERQMTWQAERGAFVATVSHVLQPFDYEISGGHTRTRAHHVDVVDRPMLTSVKATIDPPAYSGRVVEQIEGAVGELQMLAGSRVTLQLQFNQPVERTSLLWMPDRTADEPPTEPAEVPGELQAGGASAVVEFQPDRSGRFALQLFDSIGLANSHDPHRRVRIFDDAPPTVRFADRAASQAAPNDVLRLPVEITDDIGLAGLELHFAVDGEGKQQGVIDSGLPLLGVREAEHEFILELQPLGLTNGMILSVRARATDERAVPGPNESWTEPRLITISDQADPYDSEELAQRQQELAQALQRLRTTVAENQQATKQLQAQAAQQQPGTPFAGDRDIASVTENDRESAADAERLAAQFDLHPLLTSLGDRARSVAQGQLTSAADHSQAAHDAQPADKSAALDKAGEQLADASAELDAMQRDLESLAELEQDLLELQRLADDAERLAQNVSELQTGDSAASDDAAPEEGDTDGSPRGREADRLRNDHADLSRRLDNLLDRRPELLDAAAEASLDQLDGLREHALQLAERQQQLAEGLQGEAEATPPDPQQVAAQDELAGRQAGLVHRAVQMAHAAADSGSRDAEPLRDIAEQSARATEALAAGDLAAASESARQAAEQAAELAAQPDRGSNPEETSLEELNELAAQQQQAAQEMAEAANSAAARAAARQQGQQRLSDSTQQLQQNFQQIAERLASEPLSRADDGARATESSSAAEQAGGFMAESTAAQQRGELTAAAEAANAAAAELAIAAEQALKATADAKDSPVPTDVGEQVAQASQQLRRAGEQLGDTPPGESSANQPEDGESAAREQAAGDGQQAATESPMTDPAATPQAENEEGKGQAQSGSQGSDFAEAAAALHAAAQRLKPRAPGDQQSPSESGMSQQPGAKSQSQSAANGSGTTETARLAELAAKIKARSMRNWGELPGELRSELQQRTQSRPDADYAPLIRMYFDEISRQPSPATAEPP
ncbi:MAG: hypothetical protein JNG89_19820 [Planctomycetaceae bacterium]|nr:hypothetical protein [Planctomycetaceae bacterium]